MRLWWGRVVACLAPCLSTRLQKCVTIILRLRITSLCIGCVYVFGCTDRDTMLSGLLVVSLLVAAQLSSGKRFLLVG